MQALCSISLALVKTILIILSLHSISSGIHFMQIPLVLEYHKKIKDGLTRGIYCQEAMLALGPTPTLASSVCIDRHVQSSVASILVSRFSLSWVRSKFFEGKVETEAISEELKWLCCDEVRPASLTNVTASVSSLSGL